MGKIRYYCEYCDRSFLDDLKARKKHLSGAQHARMRKQYYKPFRSATEIYEEEKEKDPCRKFLMQNMCPFGENCKYSHYTPFDMERLSYAAAAENHQLSSSATPWSVNEALGKMSSSDKVEKWLTTWKARQEEKTLKPVKPAVTAVYKAWSSEFSTQLSYWGDLPPSLQQWTNFNLHNVYLEDWG